VSPGVRPSHLRLAGRAAQVIKDSGALRDAELRAAIPIVIRWRKADRGGDYLVAVPPRRKGRPAA